MTNKLLARRQFVSFSGQLSLQHAGSIGMLSGYITIKHFRFLASCPGAFDTLIWLPDILAVVRVSLSFIKIRYKSLINDLQCR